MQLAPSLYLKRCPHCHIANPSIVEQWPATQTSRSDGYRSDVWAGYRCTTCGNITTVRCQKSAYGDVGDIEAFFPEPKIAHEDIPDIARTYLQQAYETLHAPDAAAVMAGSAVDAMLKKLGYKEGSVYERIESAVENKILTAQMGTWAHSVRLGANRPRHADDKKPHVSPEEAKQSVEFAEALGQFLFVLSAKIERGIEKAKTADAPVSEDQLAEAIIASIPKAPDI